MRAAVGGRLLEHRLTGCKPCSFAMTPRMYTRKGLSAWPHPPAWHRVQPWAASHISQGVGGFSAAARGSTRVPPPSRPERSELLFFKEQLGRLGLEGKRGPVRRSPCPAKNMVDSSTGAVRARPGMAFPAGSAGHLVKPDRSFRLDASDQDSRFGSKLRCASAVKYAQGLLTRDDKSSHPELLSDECFLRETPCSQAVRDRTA